MIFFRIFLTNYTGKYHNKKPTGRNPFPPAGKTFGVVMKSLFLTAVLLCPDVENNCREKNAALNNLLPVLVETHE